MTLADHQRAIARYCLAEFPDPDDVRSLGGDRARWDLYRAMVRRRFVETVGDALPRTRAALGATALALAVDRYLAQSPPTTRYVRELGVRFAGFLQAEGLAEGVLPWVPTLAVYEAVRLEVACAPDVPVDPCPPCRVGEFAMDRPAVFAPAHRLLRMDWDVHCEDRVDGHRAETVAVLVCRDPVSHRVDALALSPIAADIVEALAPGDHPVTACVLAVLGRHQAAAGEVFMASLADLLGELLDRGVIVGGLETLGGLDT